MTDVTRILTAIDAGDAGAADELLPLVYDELRRLAAARLRRQPAGQTLQPTALVHEAFARLVGSQVPLTFDGKTHFFASAAVAMRRILIDRARRKRAVRHGGGLRRRMLSEVADVSADEPAAPADLLALHEALERLAAHEPVMAELVQLRYFAGLELTEAAAMLKIGRSTADRYWTYARAWLAREIAGKQA